MSAFCLNSLILMTTVMIIAAHATFIRSTTFDDRTSIDFYLAKRDVNDVNSDENSIESDEGFFYRVTHFFQHHNKKKNDENEEKPDFITTFDILKLFDEKYAMQQFYCVINEDPCDAVGLRLKATIPEELNRNCERCTSTESSNIRRILNYVKKHYPQFWKRVEPIYKKKTTALKYLHY